MTIQRSDYEKNCREEIHNINEMLDRCRDEAAKAHREYTMTSLIFALVVDLGIFVLYYYMFVKVSKSMSNVPTIAFGAVCFIYSIFQFLNNFRKTLYYGRIINFEDAYTYLKRKINSGVNSSEKNDVDFDLKNRSVSEEIESINTTFKKIQGLGESNTLSDVIRFMSVIAALTFVIIVSLALTPELTHLIQKFAIKVAPSSESVIIYKDWKGWIIVATVLSAICELILICLCASGFDNKNIFWLAVITLVGLPFTALFSILIGLLDGARLNFLNWFLEHLSNPIFVFVGTVVLLSLLIFIPIGIILRGGNHE